MQHTAHHRVVRRFFTAVVLGVLPWCAPAQDTSTSPASVPAGATAPLPEQAVSASRAVAAVPHAKVSARQARQADDAYLDGAKKMQNSDFAGADASFAHAVELNPGKQEYVLALMLLREHRVTDLVQRAAKARLLGSAAEADKLLQEARALDPNNAVVTQHLAMPPEMPIAPEMLPGPGYGAALGGPIQFAPTPGKQSIHVRGGMQELVRTVYRTFGITVTFDSSFAGTGQGKLDLDDADFATAQRILAQMAHTFAVPLEPRSALIAKDTQEARDRLQPQIEETIYLPGLTPDAMNEMATIARNVFDLKQVASSASASGLLVRGDAETLRLLNATYADMLDGGSDVLLDVRLYEMDKSRVRNIGIQTPGSVGGFSVASEALNLINSNQALIQQAVANGLLKLTGNPAVDYPKELLLLLASGAVSSTQFSNLLGTIGTLQGLPLLGVYSGSTTTFNLLLNSSDVRTLDDIQVRAGSNQPANFRAGTRYPIVTATYSSGVSSSLASQLSGLNINGSSVASLLAQYQGTASATVPQVQYEDLGVTLKATPKVLHGGNVYLQLELTIEALAGGTINSIPILNNRQIKSSITVPAGETALVVSEVSRTEQRSIAGVPGLSELPGFQGTDKSSEVDSGELLITITPHIVRGSNLRIASKRLAMEHTQPPTSAQ